MKGFNKIVLLSFLLGFTACKKELTPSNYVKWVNDTKHGLHKIKQVDDLKVDVQYKPIPYIIANEYRTNNLSKTAFEKREKELNSMQYFNLKLSTKDGKNITKYKVSNNDEMQGRLHYLSFLMKQDIFLIENQDTMSCQLYHFERSYDLAPHRTFVLGFENKNNKANKTFVLDSEMFGTGPIKLSFKHEDIKRTPSIKLYE